MRISMVPFNLSLRPGQRGTAKLPVQLACTPTKVMVTPDHAAVCLIERMAPMTLLRPGESMEVTIARMPYDENLLTKKERAAHRRLFRKWGPRAIFALAAPIRVRGAIEVSVVEEVGKLN